MKEAILIIILGAFSITLLLAVLNFIFKLSRISRMELLLFCLFVFFAFLSYSIPTSKGSTNEFGEMGISIAMGIIAAAALISISWIEISRAKNS